VTAEAFFPMEVPRERGSFVLREDERLGCKSNLGSAAMVFDEAACLSQQLGH